MRGLSQLMGDMIPAIIKSGHKCNNMKLFGV